MTRKNWITALLLLPVIGHFAGFLPATMEHVRDPVWLAHAQFHALQSIFFVEGWNIFAAYVILFPFRQGARWARWALLCYLISVQVAYFIAFALIPEGRPPELVFNILFGVALLMFCAGLSWGWRES